MFYQEAIRLLPEIIELSSLESVQACLLLAAYALPIDAAGLGYVYINLTIRLAMQNGMHRRCVGKTFSAAMMETRNRVWWTAYAMERKISIFHGRPLGMLRSDVDTHLPVDAGDQDSTAVYMLASIHLTHHLEDFYKEMCVSSYSSMKPQTTNSPDPSSAPPPNRTSHSCSHGSPTEKPTWKNGGRRFN